MYLAYFDEAKFSAEDPNFFIGGLLIDAAKAKSFDQTLAQIQYNYFGSNILIKENEIHGNEIWHGKSNFKNTKLEKRLLLLEQLVGFILEREIPIRLVQIRVKLHRAKL